MTLIFSLTFIFFYIWYNINVGCGSVKKVISIGLLMGVLFLGIEILVTYLTKQYEINYSVYSDEQEFKVIEK